MEPTHTAHTPDGLLSHTTAGTHTQQKAGAKVRPSQPEERTAGDGEEDEELEELEEEEEVEEGEEALELDEEEEEGGGGGGNKQKIDAIAEWAISAQAVPLGDF